MSTPKLRFQTDAKLAKAHADYIASERYLKARDVALLEYQRQLSRNSDPNGMAKLAGANGFCAAFERLSSLPSETENVDQDNLTPTE